MTPRTDLNSEEVLTSVRSLVYGWCDRRNLTPWAYPPGYPLTSPLTDGWG